jgi:hypothetical protein
MNLSFRRLGCRAPIPLLKNRPFHSLCRSHRATSSELGIVKSVDKQRRPDHPVQIHRPILAVLEGSEAIKNDGLVRAALGLHRLLEEQAVSTQSVTQTTNRRVGDAGLSSDLPHSGAGNESMKRGLEEITALEPVGDGEGL